MLKCFCEEPMEPAAEDWYTTKCGHVFHHQCLTTWIKSSKTCPQCRQYVGIEQMFRLYPTPHEGNPDDVSALQTCLDVAQSQLEDMTKQCKEKDEVIAALKIVVDDNEKDLNTTKKELASSQRTITDYEQHFVGKNSIIKQLKDSNRQVSQRFEEFARAVRDVADDNRTGPFSTMCDHNVIVALNAVQRLIRNLTTNKNNLTISCDTIADLEHQLDDSNKNIIQLKETKRRLRQRTKELVRDTCAAGKELENAKQNIINLEQKINQLDEVTKKQQEKNLKLANELKKSRSLVIKLLIVIYLFILFLMILYTYS